MNIQKFRNIENVQELHTLFTELGLSNSDKKDSLSDNQGSDINGVFNCKKKNKINLSINNSSNNFFKLKQLKVSCEINKVPTEICKLKYLTSLNLSNNLLKSLPNEIGNLCNLVVLQLSRNKLNCLPKTIRYIQHLNFLDISHNEFYEVPDVLHYGLRILKVLDLSHNEISIFNDPPACLNKLIVLDLSNNNLKQLPIWIFTSICHLQSLNVSNNQMCLNSEIVNLCGSGIFESLQLLNIENCNFSSTNIQMLCHFKHLEVLYLGNRTYSNKRSTGKNYFGNFTVKIIENLKYVKYLYLQNVQIATLPSDFDSLKNINILDLSNNLLSWLPESFCNLIFLRIVYLTSNQLLFLPKNMGNLVNLQQIHLGNNKLEKIPEDFYELTNLEFMDFYNNKIEIIDEKIFQKKNLKGIDLELNCLNINFCGYDSLKSSFRKFFGVLHCRSNMQMTSYYKTSDELSIESQTNDSRCSTASFESEQLSDFEDLSVDVSQTYLPNYFEDEDWEENPFEVEEDELFDPNENGARQDSQNLRSLEFEKNFCPASYHVPPLITTYKRFFKLALKKEIVEELLSLREKLERLQKSIQNTVSEYQRKDAEYNMIQAENLNQSRRFIKIINAQDAKLDDFDAEIEKLELKLRLLLDELADLKESNKNESFELSKFKAEEIELKKINEKNISAMKENLLEAKEDLRNERQTELSIIKTHEAAMKNVTQNLLQKLEEAEKFWSDKYKMQKKKYKAAEEPLLNKIHYLDSEIEALETRILSKPKELEALTSRNEMLYKKLEKVTAARFFNESKVIMKSLDDALKYVEKKPENLNENLVLGVLIAKANLQWITSFLKSHLRGEVWINALEELLERCDDIINFNSYNVPLLKQKFWESAAGDLKVGILKQLDDEFVLPNFDSCRSIESFLMNGTPEDSDLCINELINSNCNVSEICWLSEINGDSHSGYKTSHRLLYFQIADRMNCQKSHPKKFSVIRAVKNKLCQKMLLEAGALFEDSHHSLTQDLFMEHIALCGGLEGHQEFAAEIWRNRVRNWQNREGCFGQKMSSENCISESPEKNNSKKADFNTDGCHSHVTAVAISVLAFFLRVTLKAVFSLL